MLKHAVAAALLAMTGVAQAFVPQSGAWIITDELNGKPGRGFSIDVQNDIFGMQVFAYESSGQPTFYMATGRLSNDNVVDTWLGRYEGGRYLGSGDRIGVERGSPGNVRIRFVSGTLGYITLPGEQEKQIKRFEFGYNNSTPESLLGLWSVVYADESGRIEHDAMELTRVSQGSSYSNGMAVSYDGMFACEQLVRGSDIGKSRCVKFRSGTSSQSVRSFWMRWSVNAGEGDWNNTGAAGHGAVYANRLMQNSGRITGILRKAPADAKETQVDNDAALRAALEQLAASR